MPIAAYHRGNSLSAPSRHEQAVASFRNTLDISPGMPSALHNMVNALHAGFHASPAENVEALDGVFIAMKRQVWETLRYDEQTFDGFQLYDADFTYRAYRAGYRIAVPLDLLLIHFSMGQYDSRWQKYNLRFLAKFPELTNILSVRRYASMHIKLQSIDQVGRMHAVLLHHRFGT